MSHPGYLCVMSTYLKKQFFGWTESRGGENFIDQSFGRKDRMYM